MREYYYPELTSHIIGYVRAIDEEEYEELKDSGYTSSDLIGKIGIEKAFESVLRGTKGSKVVYYDSDTESVKTESITPPIPGNDVYLTIDINYQKMCIRDRGYVIPPSFRDDLICDADIAEEVARFYG